MPLTRTYHKQLLDHLFMKTALTQPGNIWVGLSTTTPANDGTNVTEPSSGAYARVSTAAATWNAATTASPSVLDNAAAVTFPTATGQWSAGANMTHFTLHTAATAGTIIGFGALTTPKPVNTGDTPSFAIGDLDVKLGATTDTFT